MKNLVKNIDVRKILLSGVILVTVGAGSFITIKTGINEAHKWQDAWEEVLFAKEHPVLVRDMRQTYEMGLVALDKMVMEKNVNVVSPEATPSK